MSRGSSRTQLDAYDADERVRRRPPAPAEQRTATGAAADLLALQRSAGNQAVQRLIDTSRITSGAKKANRGFSRGKSSLRGLLDAVDVYNAGGVVALETEISQLEAIAVRAAIAHANPRKAKYRATASEVLDQVEQETLALIDRVIAEHEAQPTLPSVTRLGKLADSLRFRPDRDKYAEQIAEIQALVQAGSAIGPSGGVAAIIKTPAPRARVRGRRDSENLPPLKTKFKVRPPEPEPEPEAEEEETATAEAEVLASGVETEESETEET